MNYAAIHCPDPLFDALKKAFGDALGRIDTLDACKGPAVLFSGEHLETLPPDTITVQFGGEKTEGIAFYIPYAPEEPDLALLKTLIDADLAGSTDPEEELRREYRHGLFEKFGIIHEKGEQLDEVRKIVHKMAGNAGLYGFNDASAFAKTIEQEIDSGSLKPDALPEKITALKQAFCKLEIAKEAPKQEAPTAPSSGEVDVYCIDDDEDLIKLLELEGKKSSLNIVCETSFSKAKEKLKDPSFQPHFLLVDIYSAAEQIDGFDLVQTYKMENPGSGSTIVGILSGKSDTANRVRAYELGIDIFFEKPIAPDVLLYQIGKYNESTEEGSYNVLLVDDDTDFTNFVQKTLEGKSYTLKVLNSPDTFLDTIRSFKPDLILLDVFMPNVSGLELLSILHSDYRYRKIPVAIVSGAQNPDVMKKAYSLGIQDFISKPIDGPHLVRTLDTIRKKQRSLDIIFDKDSATGLYSRETLENQFRTYELNYNHVGLLHFFLFSPTKPNDPIGNDTTKYCADLLSRYFSHRDIVGIWEPNHFVILMANLGAKQLRTIVDNFFREIEKDPFFENIALSAMVTAYPKEGNSLAELAETVSGKFITEPWHIGSLEEVVDSVKAKSARNIQIVTSNFSLSKILNYSLQLRGYHTVVSTSAKEGVDWLNTNFMKEPPTLIILDTELDDEEPTIVLEMIKNLVGERVPIFMLSSFAREEDISTGIGQGATNYFTKPFSLNILLQAVDQVVQ